MKALVAFAGLAIAVSCVGLAPQDPSPKEKPETTKAPERPEDDKAIRELDAAFEKAYDKGDAQAIAALFTEDAEVSSDEGEIHGRKAITEHFAAVFAESPGETLKIETESIRYFGADIARETGKAVSTPKNGKPSTTRFTALLVKKDGKWLQAGVHEYEETLLTPHDRLKELEWMLGEWVDEGDDGVVHTTCRWSEDKNFLLRDFVLRVAGQPEKSGSQRIGWEPLSGRFKSWIFDPDGGHSEAIWDRSGENQWIVRATGVTGDGLTVSSTQIVTLVDKGTIKWKSVLRAVGGEAVPDLDEITLVRTPPKPVGSSKPAK